MYLQFQISQGMRQFPITYSGDPELQPIRSYESLLAVKGLYWISCKLNIKVRRIILYCIILYYIIL